MRTEYLSKREQQIMEAVHRLGRATALQVAAELPGAPSKSTVRTLLRILEDRGRLSHEDAGGTYVYRATEEAPAAGQRALAGVLRDFFGGSVRDAAVALLDDETLSEGDAAELRALIDRAREAGR